MTSIRGNRFRAFLIFLSGLTLAVCACPDCGWSEATATGARIALLIGNATYADAGAPLRQPSNNIRILADELQRNGFLVEAKENLGKRDLLRALDEFRGRIELDSTAVFFFSGYSLQKERESYVIPIDAHIWAEDDIDRDGVNLDSVLSRLKSARIKLVILDVSRRNPYEPRFRSEPAGLAPVIAPAGSLILSAAAPGKVILDHGDSSIFIRELVKGIHGSALTIEGIIRQVRRNIARRTKGEQVLWMSSSLLEDFFFKLPSASSPKTGDGETLQLQSARIDTQPPAKQSGRNEQHQPELPGRQTEALNVPHIDTAEKAVKPHEILRDCTDCPEMVVVPSGSFQMGSSDFSFEKPVHRVRIAKPFAIGRREITVDEWNRCVSAGRCARPRDDARAEASPRAATDVSWSDAKAYVAWLSQETGRTYRLPSEAEWEYATRAGTRTPYWWGRSVDPRFANCRQCGRAGERSGVGPYFANPFGLFDTSGNAAEWVEDCWNENYRKAPTDGSAWLSGDCRRRVLRGGSFDNSPRYLRSASRFRYDADVRYFANGFRVVRELP